MIKDFYELIVQDNGVGIPENIDTKKGKGLGFKNGLPYLPVGNSEVHLHYEQINGTRVTIKVQKITKN